MARSNRRRNSPKVKYRRKPRRVLGGLPRTKPRTRKGKKGQYYKKGKSGKWIRQDLARDRKRKAKRVRGAGWSSHVGDMPKKRT